VSGYDLEEETSVAGCQHNDGLRRNERIYAGCM
jgi:hypothetical protein